jgi:hypothetical protein
MCFIFRNLKKISKICIYAKFLNTLRKYDINLKLIKALKEFIIFYNGIKEKLE